MGHGSLVMSSVCTHSCSRRAGMSSAVLHSHSQSSCQTSHNTLTRTCRIWLRNLWKKYTSGGHTSARGQ
jgi:hypothetical protein